MPPRLRPCRPHTTPDAQGTGRWEGGGSRKGQSLLTLAPRGASEPLHCRTDPAMRQEVGVPPAYRPRKNPGRGRWPVWERVSGWVRNRGSGVVEGCRKMRSPVPKSSSSEIRPKMPDRVGVEISTFNAAAAAPHGGTWPQRVQHPAGIAELLEREAQGRVSHRMVSKYLAQFDRESVARLRVAADKLKAQQIKQWSSSIERRRKRSSIQGQFQAGEGADQEAGRAAAAAGR